MVDCGFICIPSWGRIFLQVFHQSNQLAILQFQWTRHPLEKSTGDQIDQNAPTLEQLSLWKYSRHHTTLVANIREAIDSVPVGSFPNGLVASSTREKKNKRFQIHSLKYQRIQSSKRRPSWTKRFGPNRWKLTVRWTIFLDPWPYTCLARTSSKYLTETKCHKFPRPGPFSIENRRRM